MADYNLGAVLVLFTFPALGGFLFGYGIHMDDVSKRRVT